MKDKIKPMPAGETFGSAELPTVEAYLDHTYRKQQSRAPHALARLLLDPQPDRGVLHTPREIAQQPTLWRYTARLMQEHATNLGAFLEKTGLFEQPCRPNLILSGAGTSDYVGLSVSDLLRRRFRTSSSNWPTTRITAFPDAFLMPDQRYVLLHFARSGNSPESRAVLELALRQYGDTAWHVVITCNEDGDLARIARAHPDRVYLITLHEACNDRGLAMTSSFTSMVVAAQAVAYLDEMETFGALVERTARAGEHLMDHYAEAIYELATSDVNRAFYLGNADLLGAATESALKVQELTAGQVTAKGEDTLGFRHGPVSAVDDETLVCFYLSAEPYTQRYEMDVLAQYMPAFTEMGVRTVVVSGREREEELGGDPTWMSYDPDGLWQVPALHQVNVAVLFGQLFGMFASFRRGQNVDEPSVSKQLYSRTVQGVKLYDYDAAEDGNGHDAPGQGEG